MKTRYSISAFLFWLNTDTKNRSQAIRTPQLPKARTLFYTLKVMYVLDLGTSNMQMVTYIEDFPNKGLRVDVLRDAPALANLFFVVHTVQIIFIGFSLS